MENIQNCYICKHLGWENVGEGLNPICEKDSKYVDIDKSRPTVVDFNRCKLFERKSKAMAEYIDAEAIENEEMKHYRSTLNPHDAKLFVEFMSWIDDVPISDVVERSEYDKLHKEYLKAIHRHTECLKELHEYRSKIDKAIEEIIEYRNDDSNDFCEVEVGAINGALEILKRNIGG